MNRYQQDNNYLSYLVLLAVNVSVCLIEPDQVIIVTELLHWLTKMTNSRLHNVLGQCHYHNSILKYLMKTTFIIIIITIIKNKTIKINLRQLIEILSAYT